jgi:hypothetical protein
MPDPTTPITDLQLLDQLRASFIEPKQKEELERLLPSMDPDEKRELANLIDLSLAEKGKLDGVFQEKLASLNKEYAKGMSDLTKKSNQKARKKFEEVEKGQANSILKVVEGEFQTIDFKPKRAKGNGKRKSHTLRNWLITLLLMAACAGGVLYALNTLS